MNLRRVHAIAGVVPLGVFSVVHVLVNATALGGHASFDRVVGGLARLPVTPVVEVLFVLLPLAFHAVYGLRRALKRPADADAHGYRRPGLDLLMRMTSIVLLVFVIAHGWELRGHRAFGGGSIDALYTRLSMHLSSTTSGIPWIALGYIVALAALSFHLAYGCHAVLVAGARANRRTAVATAAAGTLLFFVGTATVIAVSTGGTLLGDGDSASSVPCAPAASSR